MTNISHYIQSSNQLKTLHLSWTPTGTDGLIDYYQVIVQNREHQVKETSVLLALEPGMETGNYSIRAVDLCGKSGNATTGIIEVNDVDQTTVASNSYPVTTCECTGEVQAQSSATSIDQASLIAVLTALVGSGLINHYNAY